MHVTFLSEGGGGQKEENQDVSIVYMYVDIPFHMKNMFFLCLRQRSGRRHYVFGSSVRPSRFFCVDISGTVRRFYIILGMRVYPGGTTLWVDFKVTGSKVKGHRLFCVNLVQCLAYYET